VSRKTRPSSGARYRPDAVGGGTTDRTVQPRLDPSRTTFERTAAFRRYGATSELALDPKQDRYTKEIIREQGFGGKPHVVSRPELDRYVADGETEIFRGLTSDDAGAASEYADQFRDGDLFVGRGGFGNGVYTTVELAVAREFAGDTRGCILRMAIKKHARIGDYDEIRRVADDERDREMRRLRAEQSRAVQ
jgi:hypothetical protein